MVKRRWFLLLIFSISGLNLLSCSMNTSASEMSNFPTEEVTGMEAPSQIDGAELIYIPAGPFLRGSAEGTPNSQDDEKPQSAIYLDGFWIDAYEVTNAQYALCVEAGACEAPTNQRYFKKDIMSDHPVTFVTWWDAVDYCEWTGRRLPTEAEWEKAARGVDGFTYPWGEQAGCEFANYGECTEFERTAPVGSFTGIGDSVYGVHDMGGNVWEWIVEWYKSWFYSIAEAENPVNPRGDSRQRVVRGGAWSSSVETLRTANRDSASPEFSSELIGFRCALSPQ